MCQHVDNCFTSALLVRTAAFCTLLIGTFLVGEPAQGCSLGRASVGYSENHNILIARISAHRELLLDSGPAFGFGIEPVHVFGRSDPLSDLTIIPGGTGSGCDFFGLYPKQEIFDQYKIGTLVALHVGLFPTIFPDTVYALPRFNMDVIHESCDLDAIGTPQATWDIPRQCGSVYLYANALAAAITTFNPHEIDESLQQLAIYPGLIRYEELVRRFVPEGPRQRELIELRYGNLTYDTCRDPASKPTSSREEQFLYQEFCELSRDNWE